MKIIQYILLGVVIAFVSGSPEEELVQGSNLFSAHIYNELPASPENILISPFSAETIVALTQSGAQGATGEEIRTALHLPNTKEATEEAMKSILPKIHSDLIALTTANKIFVENAYPVKDDFKKVAVDVYQAEWENVEFSQETASEINEWVEEHTGNKIHDLMSPDDISQNTKIILVNALYFKGNWTIPFDPLYTKTARFYTTPETTVDTIMMYQESETHSYYNSVDLDAQMLQIPFLGGEATMTFVLPNKKDGISALEKQMEAVLRTPIFTKEYVKVLLPKFKIESTIDVKQLLKKLGVEKAFTPGADFSGIAGAPGELFIGEAKQKTFIDVNEYGVEAAAATAIGGEESENPGAYRAFIADHPFIFYIKIHDIILFEGRVSVPKY